MHTPIALLILCALCVAWTAQGAAIQSSITEVEGSACMGDDRSRKETERVALAEARRTASEFASNRIRSKTVVEDLVLKEDLVAAFSQATVKIINVLERQWYEDKLAGLCFRVRVQAEVIPDETAMAQIAQQQPQPEDPRLPLQAKVWTDKTHYTAGEKVRIFLRANKPFYAQVVYRDAQGNLVQLLPNPYRRDNYFAGGVTYQLPSGADRYQLTVASPFGQESVILYASTAPHGRVRVKQAGAYYLVTTPEADVGHAVRGVRRHRSQQQGQEPGETAEFVEARVDIRASR
jgi:hypothetical protein